MHLTRLPPRSTSLKRCAMHLRHALRARTSNTFGRPLTLNGQIARRSPMVPPLHCLATASGPGAPADWGETQPMEEVRSSSEEDCQDTALQVHDWRFSELETTNLATLREVDLCVPFQFPSMDSARWQGFVPFPAKGPQNKKGSGTMP